MKNIFGKKNPNYKTGETLKTHFCKCGNKIHLSTALYGSGKCFDCSLNKRKPKKCLDCGILITYECKRCGKCNGINSQKHYYCLCGNEVSTKHTKQCQPCYSLTFNGENNPNWQGGLKKYGYPYEFNSKLKFIIRKRDNFECQKCGLIEQKHFKLYNCCLTVHHIDYNKENCDELNLITLCHKCNPLANKNRDYWFAYYTYILENKNDHIN